jgi:hypothetical protein
MQRDELTHLYFITAIANVVSILEHGLLSHRRAGRLPHTDISMASVQDIRATKRVPGGLVLHEYAPLYIWARNAMLFKRQREMLSELCVLILDPGVLDLEGVVISDHNAAAGLAHFAPYPDGLEAVDKELTFAEFWTHENPGEQDRRRKRGCAEVLVPHGIHPSFIVGIAVGNETARASAEALDTGLPVRLWRYLFFQ